MNILFLVPYAPTPIRTRPYNLVRGLARRGHSVTLATLWENKQERAALRELESEGICIISVRLTKARSAWNSLRAVPSARPLQADYCWQPELRDSILSSIIGHKYGIIHIEHLRGSRYGLFLQSVIASSVTGNLQSAIAPSVTGNLPSTICHLPSRIPIVWDSVDCISHLFQQAARHSRSPFGRLVARFELGRTRRYEGRLVNQFDRVLVTSPVDAQALSELSLGELLREQGSNLKSEIINPKSKIRVLPNGVDLKYFAPGVEPREPETIVFSGKMSYHANVTAALRLTDEIMPLVWNEHPNARVQIVGKDPPSSVRKLATDNRLLITGFVPDLRPHLQCATVAVAPIAYGAGIQNKVLEAMACATPVVASPQAVSALDVRDGEQILLGDGPEASARQVLRLLEDAALRQRIGQAGRQYVEQCHDWDGIVAQLEAIYREMIVA